MLLAYGCEGFAWYASALKLHIRKNNVGQKSKKRWNNVNFKEISLGLKGSWKH